MPGWRFSGSSRVIFIIHEHIKRLDFVAENFILENLTRTYSPVAQLAEQVAVNHWVAGSNPARGVNSPRIDFGLNTNQNRLLTQTLRLSRFS